MPPREEFPTKGLEGAPSNDIGWHFGTLVPNAKGNIICKLCGKVVKGGITRFKEHITHKTGNVAPCPNVTGVIRESMMNVLKESNTKKTDKKRRKDDLLSQLREEEDGHEEFIDEISVIRQATREKKGRSSQGSSIPTESKFTLRGAIPELVRSKSSKQQKEYKESKWGQQNSTPSQSGDGPNGGGLRPVDEDDGYNGDRGEIRSSSQYRGEYGVGTTSGYFRDRSEFDGNMFPEPRRDRSEPRAPSKGKGKKHTSIGSSSGRRSGSSNLGYSDSFTSTQGFYPPEQPSYFQPSHGYPQPYGYYPPFPNYGVPYQPQMHPPPQIYPPHQLYENQCENVTFFGYIFGQRPRESSQERSQSEGDRSDLPRHSTIGEN
ncbi:hypothetical protein GOBAR_AA28068 [Gossypium barbadense]|uniref:BED-type domain-containing protein n=1 Tax=Gossypium barbadense TaxID=3634 RepID=A0A2P5WNB8_GOSBA|nr:hypothetical protein GOBAR_AA28068 [Gossypium barbadense]